MKRWLPVLIFVAGLAALTAAAALTVSLGPFDRSPAGNEALYWGAAQKAAKGELDGAALSAYPSPLYPRFLGVFAGDDVLAARTARRVLTFLFLPVVGALVYALARRRAGPWVSAVAAWLAVFAAPMVLSAGAFSPSMPAALLCGIALVTLDGKRGIVAWAVAGALVGLSGQFHGPLAWAVGALLVVMAVLRPKEQPGRRGWALCLGAFALLWVAASWGGATIAGSRSPLPPWRGVDVYRGHRAEASGVEPRRGDTDAQRLWVYRDFAREASRLSGERLTSAQTSAFWARKAVGEALRHPFAELKRTGVKILATYQGDPLPRDVSPDFLLERGETGALPVSMWLGRIALPLGLAGLVLARRRAGWILWIAALSGLLVALATFAEADARGLSVLGLAVGLALFLDRLWATRGAARVRTALERDRRRRSLRSRARVRRRTRPAHPGRRLLSDGRDLRPREARLGGDARVRAGAAHGAGESASPIRHREHAGPRQRDRGSHPRVGVAARRESGFPPRSLHPCPSLRAPAAMGGGVIGVR